MKNGKTTKTKIAIACQGGGSQTAFTAGVLASFFENKVHLIGYKFEPETAKPGTGR